MIKVISFSKKTNMNELENFLNKRRSGKNINTSIVNKIIMDVKKNKNVSVKKYELKFSKNKILKPKKGEIIKSISKLDKKVKLAIDFSYKRIFNFHRLQKINDIKMIDEYKNKIEYKNIPLESVGIYVPANLPSTLLMNAIPAKIAGVKRIVLANPRVNGKLNAAVMYVAKKCGIKEIINVGGAQAIASLAYIQKVNKIVGPGNDYVAKAKKIVFGDVGTEGMVAGPSEISVVADNKSNINHVITSTLAQAEHDPRSQSIIITKDKNLVINFKNKILAKVKHLPRKNIILKSLRTYGAIILARSDKQIIDAINLISPEHLEILSKNYKKYLKKVNNAGSIGIGKYSPVAASDYSVGTNHTLGCFGTTKFASGLNLYDFNKKFSQFNLTKKGIEVIGKQAITLAKYENLHAHVLSIKSRL